MKIFLLILSILFSKISFTQISDTTVKKKSEKHIEWECRELNGKVLKTKIIQSSKEEYDSRGNVTKQFKNDKITFSKKYDNSNNLIELITYSNSGKVQSKEITKYDENNNIIERLVFGESGKLSDLTVKKYNEFNKIILDYEYIAAKAGTKGSLAYLFDENNKTLMKNPFISAVGILFSYSSYIYVNDTLISEIKHFLVDPDNILFHNINKVERYKYSGDNVTISTFDSNGYLKDEVIKTFNSNKKIVQVQSYNSSRLLKNTTLYKYDYSGRETSRVTLRPDGSKSEETIHYYNTNGNITEKRYFVSIETLFENRIVRYANNRIIEEINLDRNNNQINKNYYSYYDNGMIKKLIADSGTSRIEISYEYEYDSHNNIKLITERASRNNIVFNLSLFERQIEYFLGTIQ